MGALELDCELIDVGNVAEISNELFGPNPLMQVPTLVDADHVIFDSDHIAQYLTRKYDLNDRFNVLTTDINLLNSRSVMNGIMSAGVEIVLAQRSGIDTTAFGRFDKVYSAIENGLSWLENQAGLFNIPLSYTNFHLTCLWDHLDLYQMVPLDYNYLEQSVKLTSKLHYVKATVPR